MKLLKICGILLALAASVSLILIGQMNRGPVWLLVMLIGLAGLLTLLWLYNRPYSATDKNKKRGRKGGANE